VPLIETDRVSLRSGNPEPVTVPTASGRLQEIYRCPLLQGSSLERLGAVAEMVPDTTDNVIDYSKNAEIGSVETMLALTGGTLDVFLPLGCLESEIFRTLETSRVQTKCGEAEL
jgi:hypothetical protein